MSKYRQSLPQLEGDRFLTDGGMETTLVFHEGWELPCFASFVLLETEEGRAALRAYYERYIDLARRHGTGIVLDAPTWRANPDWGAKLGYDANRLEDINRQAVTFLEEIRRAHENERVRMPISAAIGPRGDGYDPGQAMSFKEATEYHGWQVGLLAGTATDFVSAMTMTSIAEGAGVAAAARKSQLPCVISFTLETDGRLPTGELLKNAIEGVDRETDSWPAYYMINCAHPTHFENVLAEPGEWRQRIGGIRANSSRRSHAELDNASDLDTGDPQELGQLYAELLERLPHLKVVGGCCGTDERHIAEIAKACCGGEAPRAR